MTSFHVSVFITFIITVLESGVDADTSIDKPVFGQYAFAGPSGAILRTGDSVYVTERNQRT